MRATPSRNGFKNRERRQKHKHRHKTLTPGTAAPKLTLRVWDTACCARCCQWSGTPRRPETPSRESNKHYRICARKAFVMSSLLPFLSFFFFFSCRTYPRSPARSATRTNRDDPRDGDGGNKGLSLGALLAQAGTPPPPRNKMPSAKQGSGSHATVCALATPCATWTLWKQLRHQDQPQDPRGGRPASTTSDRPRGIHLSILPSSSCRGKQ